MRLVNQKHTKMKKLLLLLLFITIVINAQKRTMVWLCLDICDSKPQIERQLVLLNKYAPTSLSTISFELYTLTSQTDKLSEFTNITRVYDKLKTIKNFYGDRVELYPMISS